MKINKIKLIEEEEKEEPFGWTQRMRGIGELPEYEEPKLDIGLKGQVGLSAGIKGELSEESILNKIKDVAINVFGTWEMQKKNNPELQKYEDLAVQMKSLTDRKEQESFCYKVLTGQKIDDIFTLPLEERKKTLQLMTQLQRIPINTTEKFNDLIGQAGWLGLTALMSYQAINALYKAGMVIEDKVITGKQLKEVLERAKKAYNSETGKFTSALSDNDYSIVKRLYAYIKTGGTRETLEKIIEQKGGLKAPQRVFLGQAGNIENIVKIIQNTKEITPKVASQLMAMPPQEVSQVIQNLAIASPAIASKLAPKLVELIPQVKGEVAVEKPEIKAEEATPKVEPKKPTEISIPETIIPKVKNIINEVIPKAKILEPTIEIKQEMLTKVKEVINKEINKAKVKIPEITLKSEPILKKVEEVINESIPKTIVKKPDIPILKTEIFSKVKNVITEEIGKVGITLPSKPEIKEKVLKKVEPEVKEEIPKVEVKEPIIPELKPAIEAWNKNQIYIDNKGNYRWNNKVEIPEKAKGGQIVPFNKIIKQNFDNVSDFNNFAKENLKVEPKPPVIPEGIKKDGKVYNVKDKETLKQLNTVEDGSLISIDKYYINIKFSDKEKHYERASLLSTIEDKDTGKLIETINFPVFIDKFLHNVKELEIKTEPIVPKGRVKKPMVEPKPEVKPEVKREVEKPPKEVSKLLELEGKYPEKFVKGEVKEYDKFLKEEEEKFLKAEAKYPQEIIKEEIEELKPLATPEQVKKAHTIADSKNMISEAGKVKPQYRALAKAMTGKPSIKNMTNDEAETFINALDSLVMRGKGLPPRIPTTKDIITQDFAKKIPKLNEIGIKELIRPAWRVFQKIGLYEEVFEPAFEAEIKTSEELLAFKENIDKLRKSVGKGKEESKKLFNVIENPKEYEKLSPKEKKVIDWGKEFFEDWANKLKLEPEKRREKYITHIFEREIAESLKEKYPLDPNIVSALDFITPKTIFNPYLQERLGKTVGLKEDFWAALEAYEGRALKKFYYEPLIQRIRVYPKYLPPNAARYLRDYITRITGRPLIIDREVNQSLKEAAEVIKKLPGGKRLATILTQGNASGMVAYNLAGIYYEAYMGFRPLSAIKNLSQHGLILAEVGPKAFTQALIYPNLKERNRILSKSLVLRGRKIGYLPGIDESFIKQLDNKRRKATMLMFRLADKKNVSDAYLAGFFEAKNKGLPDKYAYKRGDEVAQKTQYLYTKLSGPQLTQSSIGRVMGVLTTWPENWAELMNDWVQGKPSEIYKRYEKDTGKKITPTNWALNRKSLWIYLGLVSLAMLIHKKTRLKALYYTGWTSLKTIADLASGKFAGLELPGLLAQLMAGIATGDMTQTRSAARQLRPDRFVVITKELEDVVNGKKDWMNLFVYLEKEKKKKPEAIAIGKPKISKITIPKISKIKINKIKPVGAKF